MHPQVVSDRMGTCPICHMDLVMVKKHNSLNPGEIYLNDDQLRLGNIKTDTLSIGNLNEKMVLTGVLNYNQNERQSISSRIMGRIDKLYFKSIGDYVVAGSPLYEIYSEELNNAKQEYILAIKQKNSFNKAIVNVDDIIAASANKLLLWGLSKNQIKDLESNKTLSNTTTFYSSSSGYITSIVTQEGSYVMEGGNILDIANLSTLWVETQAYSSQLSLIQKNSSSKILIPDLDNLEMNAKVEFINPELNSNSRINTVRFTVANNAQKLKPGMAVYVIIENPSIHSITLPTDAVIRDDKGVTVWIQTGKNTFKSKMVEIGIESENKIEIKSGLNIKDVVVTSGAYLLNSEFIFKNGADPMAGMKM
ncbi:Cu(I)/Ag(I) efflux system membrane fusion protein [Arcicella sp. BE139]|nr:Cu(I)/Ag(I) efflux system membrane fusion protein [Arcicella sp. BE139]